MNKKKIAIVFAFIFLYVGISLVYSKVLHFKKDFSVDEKSSSNEYDISSEYLLLLEGNTIINNIVLENTKVFDNLTMNQLVDKLNRSLNSDLANKGEIFATHSLSLGIDPYLAVAIVLQETGCKWDCSYLVKYCNNVGGQKGSPSCNGGSYKYYNTLDEGIVGYLDNLYYNYYSYGLTTAEAINPKYAESMAWSYNVNSYIEKIKAA